MKANKLVAGIIALSGFSMIVLGQDVVGVTPQATPLAANSRRNYDKYSTVDFDSTPEVLTAAEIEERKIKNKRYDVMAPVLPQPPADAEWVNGFDVVPYPDAIPESVSSLIIVGSISSSKALLSNEKKGIYTEYTVTVEKVLKEDETRGVYPKSVITIDRPGGVVRYATGQRVLYTIDGQPLPEGRGRFVFFLGSDDTKNPNYKIVNAYILSDGKVSALDHLKSQLEFTGKTESDFLKLVTEKVQQAKAPETSTDPPDNRDLSKYGSVQRDGSDNPAPNEERRIAGQRYDNQEWVFSSLRNGSSTGGVGKITHDPIAPPFPIDESSLIVTGEVVSVKAFLSNDRRGVYSEFTIRPDELLKDTNKVGQKLICADREGGVVVYPAGQRVMYFNSSLSLPLLNGRYVFFFAREGESPNYVILAAYDMEGKNVRRLEEASTGPAAEQPEHTSKSRFLEAVRSRISQSR